jgi:hypothetical protein
VLRLLLSAAMGSACQNRQWPHSYDDLVRDCAAAEKVARYRHAQLSAVRLAGDINAKMDSMSLDELLASIRQEWAKLGPLIDLEAVQAPRGSRTEVA